VQTFDVATEIVGLHNAEVPQCAEPTQSHATDRNRFVFDELEFRRILCALRSTTEGDFYKIGECSHLLFRLFGAPASAPPAHFLARR